MAYLLASTSIKAPQSLTESNSQQFAQNRTLDGSINRDYFGELRRVWELNYSNMKPSDYSTIRTIYEAYLAAEGSPVAWEVTETNYTVSATTVHVDLQVRDFNVRGDTYISNCKLILTEA